MWRACIWVCPTSTSHTYTEQNLFNCCHASAFTFQLPVVPVVDKLVWVSPPTQEALLVGGLHVAVDFIITVEALAAESAVGVAFEATVSKRAISITNPQMAIQVCLAIQGLLSYEDLRCKVDVNKCSQRMETVRACLRC